jgi:penicillin-insensitive murein endopeptidase
VPKPVSLVLALALAALSPAALAAEAPDEASAAAHARPKRARHRRAKADEPAARAGRAGAAPRAEPAKRAPIEKAESIGSPNAGRLQGGAHLDLKKPYFRVVPSYESGDVRWGLPIMINMIDRAARIIAKRFPGSVLDVGDISKKGGGDLLRHHSHETGRDADLGFYAVDAKGKQLHGHGFIKFDAGLSSPNSPGAKFDLARNWAFVQELLSDPAARVSHIFIAEYLRRELLAFARHRVSRQLFDRAAVVMMQPHNSLPHDDHFHVRISCPHEAHSTCIELARNAPHGKARVAHRGPHGAHPIKTPHPHPGAPKAMKPPPAVAVVSQDPFALPAAPGPEEMEGDNETRDEGDDGGATKIID